MTRIFCDVCGEEVKKETLFTAECVQKAQPFSEDNVRVNHLCNGCANQIKIFMKGLCCHEK